MRRIAAGVMVFVLVAQAQAGVRQLSLRDLCAGADRVVIGGIHKLECRWSGSMIVTDVTVVPLENLKGTGEGPFMVTIPGGTIGGTTLNVGETPVFATGEQVVLFVKSGGSPCGVYGWFRGKYTIVEDRIRELPKMPLARFRDQILDEVNR